MILLQYKNFHIIPNNLCLVHNLWKFSILGCDCDNNSMCSDVEECRYCRCRRSSKTLIETHLDTIGSLTHIQYIMTKYCISNVTFLQFLSCSHKVLLTGVMGLVGSIILLDFYKTLYCNIFLQLWSVLVA